MGAMSEHRPTLLLRYARPSKRMAYAAEVMFGLWGGLKVEWERDAALVDSVQALLNGQTVAQWPVHSLSLDDTPCNQEVDIDWRLWRVSSPQWGDCQLHLPCGVGVDREGWLGWDVLGSGLFGLTCWAEQAGELLRDNHDRPMPSDRLKGRESVQWGGMTWPAQKQHQLPWLECMASLLLEAWGHDAESEISFQWEATFDVDVAFQDLGRPAWKVLLLQMRDGLRGKWSAVRRRVAVRNGSRRDAYDSYDWIKEFHRNEPLTWYMLLASRQRPYDVGLPPNSSAIKGLKDALRHHEGGSVVRWHPGYEAMSNPNAMAEERKRFLEWGGGDRQGIRAHFLRSNPGKDWVQWTRQGVEVDASLGWARDIGFRAGVSRKFPAFDLTTNERLALQIQPIAMMDSALKHGLKLSPDQVAGVVLPLMGVVAQVGGTWSMCWHNTSVSDAEEWKGWRATYVHIVDGARAWAGRKFDHGRT